MVWEGICCERFSNAIDEGFINADFINNIFQIQKIDMTYWDKSRILEYDEIEFKVISYCPFCGKKSFKK